MCWLTYLVDALPMIKVEYISFLAQDPFEVQYRNETYFWQPMFDVVMLLVDLDIGVESHSIVIEEKITHEYIPNNDEHNQTNEADEYVKCLKPVYILILSMVTVAYISFLF
jgi:hypothetical protein